MALPAHELGLRVEFDTTAFDAASIGTLIERFERVLAFMTADPTQRLSSVDLLDAGEHARLDGLTNRAVLLRAPSVMKSIPEVFAGQVARAPQGVALTFEGRSLTYADLDQASNRLANLLVERGAGPGESVVLMVPVVPRRWWACWRSSRLVRRMCRWIRRCPRRGWSSWWPMRSRSRR